jgi:exodeoxyribonuclease VII large subunit
MVRAIMRGLLHPAEQIARQTQSLDIALAGLDAGMMRLAEVNDRKLTKLSDRLISPEQRLATVTQRLGVIQERLDSLMIRRQERAEETLSQASRLLAANSYERVLERGFVLVTDDKGQAIKRSDEAAIGAMVEIKFADKKRSAQLDPGTAPSLKPSKPKAVAAKPTSQEELF